jgi:hypothetical protein
MENDKLSKAKINARLRRPIGNGLEFDHLIKKPENEKINLGLGDTEFTVKAIKAFSEKFAFQVSDLAKTFQGKSLLATCQNIYAFMFNNIQYQIDYVVQHIRTPANIWANRSEGVECKNYSLFASACLNVLGIKHYIRKIKQPNFKNDQFTHVYVVVPKNQVTGDLSNGYFTIDGTRDNRTEATKTQFKDLYMEGKLPHEGLNASTAKSKKAKTAAKTTAKTTAKKPAEKSKSSKCFPFC